MEATVDCLGCEDSEIAELGDAKLFKDTSTVRDIMQYFTKEYGYKYLTSAKAFCKSCVAHIATLDADDLGEYDLTPEEARTLINGK